MFDIKKRAYFTTLGELRMLLKDYPDEMPVYNCGCEDSWLHVDADGKFISLDNESLYYDYCDELDKHGIPDSDEVEDYYDTQQRKEHQQRMDNVNCEIYSYPQNLIYDSLDY